MVQSKAQRKEKNSAEIAGMLEGKIRAGVYPEGSKLSTVRELANELRVNKNTVVRAYQALKKKGYLELVRGSGAFVRRREPIPENGNGHWEEQVERIVAEAKRWEIDRDQLLRAFQASVDRFYWQDDLRLAFVECNDEDIQSMSAQLTTATGHPIQGILLSDFTTRANDIATQFNLIVTTFFHLAEVRNALPASARSQLVGVNAIPNHDALLNIARLDSPVVGLVCAMSSVVDTLTHLIQTYHPNATVLSALIEERTRLETLFEKADAIVVTRGYAQQLLDLKPKAPVITVQFSIEQQSIDFLENKIHEQTNLKSMNKELVR